LAGADSVYAAIVAIWMSLYYGQLGYIPYSSQLVRYSGVDLFFAVATLGVVWGNLKRKEWSWVGSLLLQGLGVLITIGRLGNSTIRSGAEWVVLAMISLVTIVISLAIIYYFTRPHVQAYFGREIHSLGPANSDNLEQSLTG
jgi:hypothetical protein